MRRILPHQLSLFQSDDLPHDQPAHTQTERSPRQRRPRPLRRCGWCGAETPELVEVAGRRSCMRCADRRLEEWNAIVEHEAGAH